MNGYGKHDEMKAVPVTRTAIIMLYFLRGFTAYSFLNLIVVDSFTQPPT